MIAFLQVKDDLAPTYSTQLNSLLPAAPAGCQQVFLTLTD
jgi:hypothetical protein